MRPNFGLHPHDPNNDDCADERYNEWLEQALDEIVQDLFPGLVLDSDQAQEGVEMLYDAGYDDRTIPYSVESYLSDLAIDQGIYRE